MIGRDDQTDRNTLLHRRFAGGSLKVVAARAPRVAEITWACIRCPSCAGLVPEKAKFAMVTAREWRATRPEIKGHAGFRCSALISLLANASWGRLAEEFLTARNDPAELMTFVNTVLGEVWADPRKRQRIMRSPTRPRAATQRAQSACHRQVCKHPRVPTAPFTFGQERQRLVTWLRDRLGALDYPEQKRASK